MSEERAQLSEEHRSRVSSEQARTREQAAARCPGSLREQGQTTGLIPSEGQ